MNEESLGNLPNGGDKAKFRTQMSGVFVENIFSYNMLPPKAGR